MNFKTLEINNNFDLDTNGIKMSVSSSKFAVFYQNGKKISGFRP